MSAATDLAAALRQMLAVLEEERQALASLDIDALALATQDKHRLCTVVDQAANAPMDEECRGLAAAARTANEVNRRVRNLVAANVAARLDALTGSAGLYRTNATGPRQTSTHA